MTTPSSPPKGATRPVPGPSEKSTALVRAAGVLFLVAALATLGLLSAELANSATPSSQDQPFGNLLESLVLGYLGLIVTAVAFLFLYFWLPKTLPNAALLLLAVGSVLNFVAANLPPAVSISVGILISVLAVIAGIFIVRRREFSSVTSVVFLVAMVATRVVPFVFRLIPADGGPAVQYAPIWIEIVAYAALGLALVIWPATRSTSTE